MDAGCIWHSGHDLFCCSDGLDVRGLAGREVMCDPTALLGIEHDVVPEQWDALLLLVIIWLIPRGILL